MLRAIIASTAVPRAVTIGASVLLHAGVAVGLASGQGDARLVGTVIPPSSVEIAIDVAPAVTPPPPPPPLEAPAANLARASLPAPHVHAYRVAATHDAHRHDPVVDHHASAGGALAPPHAVLPAQPRTSSPEPSAEPSAEPSPEPAPRFTIALGPLGAPAAASLPTTDAQRGPRGALGSDVPAELRAGGDAAPDVTYSERDVSERARLVADARAAYPALARADGLEADVPLDVVVDVAGRVVDATISPAARAGSGFDESALAAVRVYRFSPARHHGKPVRVRMRWVVRFRLSDR